MSTTSFPTLIRTARSGSVFFRFFFINIFNFKIVFLRVTGLIRAGNLKWEDRPIWYDAYAAHPPFNEPVWHIQMPKRAEPVPKIFYPEDVERA